MDLRPSTVTVTHDGWTWLTATRRGTVLRHGLWSVVLSVLLIGLAAAATFPSRWLAVALVAGVLGAGLWLVRSLWNHSHSAVAVSALGVAVRGGFDVAQIGWPAVEAVLGVPHGKRVRILVQTRGARHQTAATFSRAPAEDWLAICAQHARQRRLHPRPVAGMAGFRTV